MTVENRKETPTMATLTSTAADDTSTSSNMADNLVNSSNVAVLSGPELVAGAVALGSDLPCREYDADLWFADTPTELEFAKSLCFECPMKTQCLEGAIEREEPWGVWGGEIFERGVIIARKKARGRPRKNAAVVEAVAEAELAQRSNERKTERSTERELIGASSK